jgi:hypothetical protein
MVLLLGYMVEVEACRSAQGHGSSAPFVLSICVHQLEHRTAKCSLTPVAPPWTSLLY